MKAWRAILLIIWIVSAHGVHAQGESPVELELSGYSYITPVPVYLSEDDRGGCSRKERYAWGFIYRDSLRWCKPRLPDATGE